ncbi:ADP-ribosyl cyclase/cyclic ADP-ribose hydrolase 2 [Willisornis vidua]|uniref:ADP-ribosyl cyclase/cyclic ADP-ribose hydrolase n=1 Tax=Willisornis vidua TaxID=1566151 RepID=A0ABQ9D1U8_9PASS|nr:ADP-ribosyl cyclase/cyclic ADP-ribose hydrolase 2 [Willisornis vidua]
MSSFSEVQGRKWKGEGTTQNLESIVIGRCYDYIRIVNPAVGHESDHIEANRLVAVWKQNINFDRCHILSKLIQLSEKNCSEIWEAFKSAFINKDPCSILPEDYELFINLSLHAIPANKSLFWENNQLLVNTFADRGRRYMSLADTLFGFFADFLNWCGQANSPDYEIPNLQKDKISEVAIWVVDDIEGPDLDSCGINSVKTLETRLTTLGYNVTCTDNYKSVMYLLCLDYPDDSKCALSSQRTVRRSLHCPRERFQPVPVDIIPKRAFGTSTSPYPIVVFALLKADNWKKSSGLKS